MTTMKPVLQRTRADWIATGLIGVLLGMLVMVGVDRFQTSSPSADTAVQQSLTGADLPRLDETTSYLKQPKTVQPQAASGAGLRDANAAEQERIIGPGEGLNSQAANPPASGTHLRDVEQDQDVIGPGMDLYVQGSNPAVSGTDLPATEHGRIIGPGEGLNFQGAAPSSDAPAFWKKY